ncbi:MAG: ribonuclease P protein subunit, partial [Thermoplasmatales archaeon]
IIGADVEILKHTDKTLIGLRGTCLDERKNILVISTERGNKIIPKTRGILLISEREVPIEKIRVRPEEKIKRARRRGYR